MSCCRRNGSGTGIDGSPEWQDLQRTCNILHTLIDAKARVYCQVLVIFDSYTKEASTKAQPRERRKGKVRITKSYIVQDSTGIKDNNTFLAITKHSLMLYLSRQLIRYSAVKVMTATRQEVMTNYECEAMPSASTQEEVDTLMIHHAVEVGSNGMNVHIFTRHGCAAFGANKNTTSCRRFMDTSEGRRKVFLQPIYDTVCQEKSGALINWNALTGCDTTADIHGKGKKGCFAAFMKASSTILTALAGLGEGDEPSEDVLRSCGEFLCSLFCPGGVQVFFVLATEI